MGNLERSHSIGNGRNNIRVFIVFLSLLNIPFLATTEEPRIKTVTPSNVRLISQLAAYTICPRPTSFPNGIQLETRIFQNYARDIKIPAILVAIPTEANEVLQISNWAYRKGYQVRALGGKHNFSPLLVSPSDAGISCPKIILVDTTVHLTSMKMNPLDEYGMASVTVGTGTKLLHLLEFLEGYGYGVFASPTIGSISVGGMLATGTHGSGVPFATLDKKSPGHTYGTLSNLITEMTLIAWDAQSEQYILKTIHRSEKDSKAFLVHLGRTFVTSVTLRVGKDQKLRTQSHFFIPAREFYAHPNEVTDTFRTANTFLSTYGRMDAVSLPEAEFVWVMTWHLEPAKPSESRLVLYPFNYIFMNYVPSVFDHLSRFITIRLPSISKFIGSVGYVGSWFLVNFTWAKDYWGSSKNHLLYLSKYTPHFPISGFTFLTNKDNLQYVMWVIKDNFDRLEKEYGKYYIYPIAGGIDFRVTGIDDPRDVVIPGAESPSISAARSVESHPEYDLVVWVDLGSLLGTPKRHEFLARFQSALLNDIDEKLAIIRPEWSKEWAFTEKSAFSNLTVLRSFSKLYSNQTEDGWNWTISMWNKYDPHKVFSNDFLDALVDL